MARDRGNRDLLVGLVFVIVGAVLLIDQTGVFDVSLSDALFGLVLASVGLYLFAARYRAGRLDRLFVPSLLVLFGALSVMDAVVEWDATAYFVPLLVVLLGVAFLTREWRRERTRGDRPQ